MNVRTLEAIEDLVKEGVWDSVEEGLCETKLREERKLRRALSSF